MPEAPAPAVARRAGRRALARSAWGVVAAPCRLPAVTDEKDRPGAITRRAVLALAGAGAAGAAVGGYLLLREEPAGPPGLAGLSALSPAEGALVEAIAARIWPGDPFDPGAREAGAVHYVDRALAGPYASYLRGYRVALHQLDAAARARHEHAFVELDAATQDALLGALQRGQLPEVGGGDSFFRVIRAHVMEGVFSDPVHGGNRGLVGWRAVGYPGPFYAITAEEQQRSGEHELPYRSLADL